MGSALLAYVAGLVTILNPCILPLLPIIIASALGQSRWGPAALAGGLVLSFSTFGLFVIAFGFSIGLEEAMVRSAAGILLVLAGITLLLPRLQMALSVAAAPLTNRLNQLLGNVAGDGAGGQFAIGAVLGGVWAPCVGPTLGVAIAAASMGQNIRSAFGIFLVFGLGVATSILAFAYLSRRTLLERRSVAIGLARFGKPAFGIVLLLVGTLIVTGLDRTMEARVLEIAPDWLVRFTTRF
jgi:cytochrome c-type biogenesis protein